MSDETTITNCIERYAENQALKEKVGGEKQANAKKILEVLNLVGSKITEVSFLKSIIKHNVFVVLTTFFLDENSNNHFFLIFLLLSINKAEPILITIILEFLRYIR